MLKIENLFPKNLYHSYIIEGNIEESFSLIKDFVFSNYLNGVDNPDVLIESYDSLKMDSVSVIKEWHKNKNLNEFKRFCILSLKSLTKDAEQTMLKILEEPKINTHFFILVPSSSILLETTKSRAHIVKLDTSNVISEKDIENFLSMNKRDRIDYVKNFIDKFKNDENSSNLRYNAINFLNLLEEKISKNFLKSKDKNIIFILNEIFNSKRFLNLPSSSVKMILENLSLII